jgi:RNA polymerase sigma-70 factor (ECF subfamily)
VQTEQNDANLIQEFLRSRSEPTFLLLYRRHSAVLYLFALRLAGGRQADAEEILQEMWIRAIRKLKDFRTDASLRNWLMGIASNCHRELKRKEQAIEPNLHAETTTAAPPSSELERSIRALPDGCREILILHDLYGYTHEEIATMLKIHDGTSKSQLFEARKRLRHLL